MNFTAGLRDRRPIFTPTHYSIANYCTDTKNDMRTTFREDLFHNLHLIPDPLKKNLADTLITEEKNMPKNEYRNNVDTKASDNSQNRAEYSPLTGISNFISGVFSVISGAMFSKRKPSDFVSDDDRQMAVPSMWQSAKSGDENKISVIENCGSGASGALPVDEMSECRAAVAHCQNKLHQVRLLLSQPVACTSRLRRRPKKVFVEPNSVEDSFEDAFSPEDFENLSNNSYLEYVSPACNQSYDFIEIDAPKTKVEISCIENTDIVQNLPEVKTNNNEVSPPIITNKKEELVASCEDKLSKLKALLQERRQKPKIIEPESDTDIKEPEKPIKPLNKVKDKKHKNPHRGTDKRKQTKMRKSIQDDLVFANEMYMEELSSVENSPLAKNLDNIFTQQKDLGNDYFDEVSGRLHSTSLPDSEDSYQIVLNDTPKRVRRPSDCESEDSFIVFEDSPDVCYTSNDVFGDTSDSDSCDSDYSDSGCGTYMSKLSHSLSKSVSNLTDDSLYANVSEDEVDCSRVENLSICETLPAVEELCHGLLLDSKKKEKRKDQPCKSVRFSEEPPKVHVMRVWAFAARQARAGHWERYAIDRERFKRRIADVDVAVSWVLKPQHRSRVIFQRFMPWWNAQKRQELAEKKQKEEEERIRQEKQGINDKLGTIGNVDATVEDRVADGGELVKEDGVATEDSPQSEGYVVDKNGEEDNKEPGTHKDKPAILKHRDSMRLILKRIEKDTIDNNVNTNDNDVNDRVAIDNEIIRTMDSDKSVDVDEVTMNHTQCLDNNKLNNQEHGSEMQGLELKHVETKLMNGRPNNQIVHKDDKVLKIGTSYITQIVKDT